MMRPRRLLLAVALGLALGSAACAPRIHPGKEPSVALPPPASRARPGVGAELERRLRTVEIELAHGLAEGRPTAELEALAERRLALAVALARIGAAGEDAGVPGEVAAGEQGEESKNAERGRSAGGGADAAERDATAAVERVRSTGGRSGLDRPGDGYGARGGDRPGYTGGVPTPAAAAGKPDAWREPAAKKGGDHGRYYDTTGEANDDAPDDDESGAYAGGAVQAAVVRHAPMPAEVLPAIEGRLDSLLACFPGGGPAAGTLGLRVTARLGTDGFLHDVDVRADEGLPPATQRCLVSGLGAVRVPGGEALGGVPVSFPLWLHAP
ncbi:MAG: hypothetical protein HY908_06575 [Myxococcales bacterium]|nr:hypothetical protein [Myxococcales bacterium]